MKEKEDKIYKKQILSTSKHVLTMWTHSNQTKTKHTLNLQPQQQRHKSYSSWRKHREKNNKYYILIYKQRFIARNIENVRTTTTKTKMLHKLNKSYTK